MSGTKFSIALGGRGLKALCGKATSWGQSSAEGTPTTLQGETLVSTVGIQIFDNVADGTQFSFVFAPLQFSEQYSALI